MIRRSMKNWLIRTGTDKVLSEKIFNFAKNTKYYGYQCKLS